MSTRTAPFPLVTASSRPPSAAAGERPIHPERRSIDRISVSHRPGHAGTSLFLRRRVADPAPRVLVLLVFVGQLAACVGAEDHPEQSHQGSARFLVAAGDSALEDGRLDDARRRYEEALSLAS